jgi:methionine-rich copper-binding protein CopC
VTSRGRSWSVIVVAFTLFVLAPAGPAAGHAELESSDPESGANLNSSPKVVTLTFTETPSKDGTLKVKDGCRRNVVESAKVVGRDIRLKIGSAEPGRWKVSFRLISAEDGHVTSGDFLLSVAGERDCSRNDQDPTPPPIQGASDDGGDSSSFPWLAMGIGTAALVGLGLILRRVTGR